MRCTQSRITSYPSIHQTSGKSLWSLDIPCQKLSTTPTPSRSYLAFDDSVHSFSTRTQHTSASSTEALNHKYSLSQPSSWCDIRTRVCPLDIRLSYADACGTIHGSLSLQMYFKYMYYVYIYIYVNVFKSIQLDANVGTGKCSKSEAGCLRKKHSAKQIKVMPDWSQFWNHYLSKVPRIEIWHVQSGCPSLFKDF